MIKMDGVRLRIPKVPSWRGVSPVRTNMDYYSYEGCEQLCYIIKSVWREVGYDNVVAYPERVPRVGREKAAYAIKTNLLNGLPPKA
jgi:hypothetical protein